MLYPDDRFHRVTDISVDYLREKGVRYLVLDVDNTLTTHGHPVPADGVKEWLHLMQTNGISPVILSNNRPERVEPFAKSLNLPCVADGRKPLCGGFERCRALFECQKKEMALVGDQLLTDVWGAHRYGIPALLVEPIEPEKMWFFRCKRLFERMLMRVWSRRAQKKERS